MQAGHGADAERAAQGQHDGAGLGRGFPDDVRSAVLRPAGREFRRCRPGRRGAPVPGHGGGIQRMRPSSATGARTSRGGVFRDRRRPSCVRRPRRSWPGGRRSGPRGTRSRAVVMAGHLVRVVASASPGAHARCSVPQPSDARFLARPLAPSPPRPPRCAAPVRSAPARAERTGATGMPGTTDA